jgi:hypothetical protein
MTAAEYQNCPDFSTATGRPGKSATRRAGEGAAAAIGITSGRELDRFCQGFIHAGQGRADLIGQCPTYDTGHAAGLKDRAISAFIKSTKLLTGIGNPART